MVVGENIVLRERESTLSVLRLLAVILLIAGEFLPLFVVSGSWVFIVWLLAYTVPILLLNRRPLTVRQRQRLGTVAFALDWLSTAVFVVNMVFVFPGSSGVVFLLIVVEAAYRGGWRMVVPTTLASTTIYVVAYMVASANGYTTPTLQELVVRIMVLLTAGLLISLTSWQVRRNRQEQQQMLDTLLLLNTGISLDAQLLEAAAAQAARLLKADAASINLLDLSTGASKIAASYHLSPTYMSQRRLSYPEREERVLIIEDLPDWAGEQAELVRAEGLASVIGVTLVGAQDEFLGMLSVYSRTPRRFREEEGRMLLPLLARLTGPLLLAQQQLQLEQQVRGLEAVQQSAAAVVSDLDLPQVFSAILDAASSNLGMGRAAIFLLDQQTGIAQIVSSRGLQPDFVAAVNAAQFKAGSGSVIGEVLLTHKPVSTPDVMTDPRFPASRALASRVGLHAFISAPLLAAEQVIGAILVYGTRPSQFAPADEGLLTIFAGYAATAIKNANLYSQLQAQHQHLQQLDQLKSDFLARLSHELRSPLAILLAYTEVLEDGSPGPLTDQQRSFLRTIRNAGHEQLATVEGLLNLAHLQAGAAVFQPEPTVLCPFAQMVLDEVRPRVQQAGLQLTAKACSDVRFREHSVLVDTTMLRLALLNLLNNAVKFTPSGGRIVVDVHLDEQQPGNIVLAICDTGVGIAPAQLEVIWSSFSQAEDAYRRQYGGLGLGLPIARQIVEKHGGRVWVESELGAGSTFYVSLPIYQHTTLVAEERKPVFIAPLGAAVEARR